MSNVLNAVFALFGDPVEHSLSPAIQNAAFLAVGLRRSYIPFRANAEKLPPLFAKLKASLAGANFTYPCKETAAGLCDWLSAEAAHLRAVNTYYLEGGVSKGFNTDVYGFGRALDDLGLYLRGQPVLVLGTGAAGRACGLALENRGVSVMYATRGLTRPRPGLSTQATVIRLSDVDVYLSKKRPVLIVNATPGCLSGADVPLFDYSALTTDTFVYDVNYGTDTALLRAAAARGLRNSDGLAMLIYQGARAFEIWTGLEAPLGIMRHAAVSELEKRRA